MKKRYYADSYTTEFQARICARRHLDGGVGLILDETYFYPTSGGQPHDTGWLNRIPVLDVLEEGDEVIHVLPEDVPGELAQGKINWARRFDHMQQHTGQHILSAAFETDLNAATTSFHLGETSCTIDLSIPDLQPEGVRQVEQLANQVVMENRPVEARFLTPEELASLSLRKPPPETHQIRIVSVQALDHSPCGGTHCRATGEVGPIKITRWSRHRQGTRVEFLCGQRALDDYAWKHEAVTRLANALTIKDRELVEAVEHLQEQAQADRRAREVLQEELLDHEALALAAQAPAYSGVKVVCQAFGDRDPEQVRRLGLRIAELGHMALLGCQGQPGRLFFARAPHVPGDMNDLLRQVCKAMGGGGGGQPHAAQGGGLPQDKVDEALDYALRQAQAMLETRLLGGKEK